MARGCRADPPQIGSPSAAQIFPCCEPPPDQQQSGAPRAPGRHVSARIRVLSPPGRGLAARRPRATSFHLLGFDSRAAALAPSQGEILWKGADASPRRADYRRGNYARIRCSGPWRPGGAGEHPLARSGVPGKATLLCLQAPLFRESRRVHGVRRHTEGGQLPTRDASSRRRVAPDGVFAGGSSFRHGIFLVGHQQRAQRPAAHHIPVFQPARRKRSRSREPSRYSTSSLSTTASSGEPA